MDRPETRYAKSGDLGIAYQVVGRGPIDVVLVPALASNIEMNWDLPGFARFLNRISSFSRLILFDRRGNGMSDGLAGSASLEEQVDDVRAVMDSAGSEEAVLLSMLEGCSLATMFAASHPASVRAAVMLTPNPRPVAGPGYEWAQTREERDARLEKIVAHWGSVDSHNEFISGLTAKIDRQTWARWQRFAMGPKGLTDSFALHGRTDVRHLLPSVQCPTLVIRPIDDEAYDRRHSLCVAEGIPGARMVETPGAGPLWVGSEDTVADEIEQFLTGTRSPAVTDRVLATVLFTDIVSSTEVAAKLGDSAWRTVLEAHDEIVRDEVERHRGRFVKSLGDGALAVFDGPSRAISAATSIRDRVGLLGLQVRAGLHTGECELLPDGDIGGLAVHISSRISGIAGPGEVLVSSTVRDLIVGSDLPLAERGEHSLKGVPGQWNLLTVLPTNTAPSEGADQTP